VEDQQDLFKFFSRTSNVGTIGGMGLVLGRIVAMGAFRRTDSHRAEIKRMKVHPDFQQRGFRQIIAASNFSM